MSKSPVPPNPLALLAQPPPDFESAAQAVLAFLHEKLRFAACMVTRKSGDDWVVLHAIDQRGLMSPGSSLCWSDTLCAQMAAGNGPAVAPDILLVPAYAQAPVNRKHAIGAYVGVPIAYADGSLFGTLCAVDPAPQPRSVEDERALLTLLGSLLAAILHAELAASAAARRGDRLQAEAHSDAMTALANRRAWEQLLAQEEERCRRHGHGAAILAVDLDGLKDVNDASGHAEGDSLIMRTADALRAAARSSDVVARLGGDEFGIIAVECTRDGVETLLARVRSALAAHGVSASVGAALRQPAQGLHATWDAADRAMYQAKQAARQTRSALVGVAL